MNKYKACKCDGGIEACPLKGHCQWSIVRTPICIYQPRQTQPLFNQPHHVKLFKHFEVQTFLIQKGQKISIFVTISGSRNVKVSSVDLICSRRLVKAYDHERMKVKLQFAINMSI